MRGHIDVRRPFRPNSGRGGSRKGKPQNKWPLWALVAAEAFCRRTAGGMENLQHNRAWAMMGIEPAWLRAKMENMFPGFWRWASEVMGPTATPKEELLKNRVYKMYYSGTSDRGRSHDPRTRAAISGEHWPRKIPEGSPLLKLHEQIDRGQVHVIEDWRERFANKEEFK